MQQTEKETTIEEDCKLIIKHLPPTALAVGNERILEKTRTPNKSSAGEEGQSESPEKTGAGFLAKSTNDKVTEQDKKGSLVDIGLFDRNRYRNKLVSVLFEEMQTMDNGICCIHDSH